MGAALCCDYKVARRGMLVLNMLIMLFALIFIGVGATSLAYGQSFAQELDVYCIQKCAENTIAKLPEDPVGCSCKPEPGHTSLPTVVFMTPAIGLIVIGVFTFIASMVGCAGAIREKANLLYIYCCILFIIVCMQIGFGAAAGAVASGNNREIQGPLEGALRKNYKKFDWANLHIFFPPACYAGKTLPNPNENITEPSYQFPLCDFETCYNKDDATDAERMCCTADYKCNTAMVDCMSGSKCLDTFFARAGAPVATMCFLPIILELLAIVFACVNVFKKPSSKAADFA